MKKILLIVLSILLLMSMVSIPAFAEADDDYLVVSSLRGAPGETVYLTICANDSFEATAMGAEIKAPEGLTFLKEESKWVPEFDLEAWEEENNPAMAVGTPRFFSGELLILAYQISADAEEGTEYKFTITFQAKKQGAGLFRESHEPVITVDSRPRELTLSHSTVTLDLCGEKTVRLEATVAPAISAVTWTSGNPGVATVEDGTVTALKKGEAIITAQAGDLIQECQILVTCSHQLEKTEYQAPSCTQMGNNAYYSCTICGSIFTDEQGQDPTTMEAQTLEKLKHDYQWVVDKEATETAAGVKHEECTVCGTKRNENTVIEKLDHVHDLKLVAAQKSTCTVAGNNAYYNCSGCNSVFTDAQGLNPTTVEAQTLEKLKHDYQWVVDKEATETATGVKHEECTVCGTKRNENTVIEKLPHVHKDLKLTAAKKSTCAVAGNNAYYTCPGCNGVFTDAQAKNPTTVAAQTLAKLDHNYQWVVDKEATETENGSKHEACTLCGAKRNENTAIEKLGHTNVTHHAAVAATCSKTGSVEYWTCSDKQCSGVYYGDKDCTIKLKTITVAVVADRHVNTELRDAVEATWFAQGYSGDTYCADCGSLIAKGKTLPMTADRPTNPFVDVADGAYYYTPVLWAVEKKITTGVTAQTFCPDNDCTRGHVVTFLWRAAGSPEPSGNSHSFTDIAPTDYYYKAVLWAVEKGITNGMSETSFAPDAVCTRAQVVTFLYRYAGKPAPSTQTHSFTDIEKGSFYYDAVLWAAETKITTGVSANQFAPDGKCNRGQIVTFLFRLLAGQ